MTLRKITAESSANVTECGPIVTPHFREAQPAIRALGFALSVGVVRLWRYRWLRITLATES